MFFRDRNGTEWQHNTSGKSLFDVAFSAIQWFASWYGPRPTKDTVLRVELGLADQRIFHVRAGRVVEWRGEDVEKWLGR